MFVIMQCALHTKQVGRIYLTLAPFSPLAPGNPGKPVEPCKSKKKT